MTGKTNASDIVTLTQRRFGRRLDYSDGRVRAGRLSSHSAQNSPPIAPYVCASNTTGIPIDPAVKGGTGPVHAPDELADEERRHQRRQAVAPLPEPGDESGGHQAREECPRTRHTSEVRLKHEEPYVDADGRSKQHGKPTGCGEFPGEQRPDEHYAKQVPAEMRSIRMDEMGGEKSPRLAVQDASRSLPQRDRAASPANAMPTSVTMITPGQHPFGSRGVTVDREGMSMPVHGPICYDRATLQPNPFRTMKSPIDVSSARLPPARAPVVTQRSAGFTLIEIMVVVVILGILAALVAPNVIRRIDDARVAKAKQDIRAYETALNLYRMDNFRYPTTEQGLESLVKQLRTRRAQLETGGYIVASRRIRGATITRLSPRHTRRVRPLHPGRGWPAGWRGADADIGNWNIE